MKKKIVNTAIDILLFAFVFAVTDRMMLKVFESENLWLELGIYIILYAIVFGAKSGIVYLWKHNVKKNDKEENQK